MQSFWEKDLLNHFDYAIVGGGIIGWFTAMELKEKFPKAHVAIFEKSLFSKGATTRNAGFACFGSVSEIWNDIQNIGKDHTYAIIEKRWKGIQELQKKFHTNQIQYESFGGYELILNNQDSRDKLEEINHFLYPIFKQFVFEEKNERIPTFQFDSKHVKSVIYNPLEGQIHSGMLILELMKKSQELGIFYFSNSAITDYQELNSHVKFQVNHGEEIKTSKLVFCTNAFPPKEIESIQPGRGQVLITKPIQNLPFKGCFHFDSGFYYFRNVGDRVLLGGGRNLDFETEKTNKFELNETIQNDLKQKLKEIILPEFNFEIDMQWSGIMAFSENKLPLIKSISKNILYAMNCNGMGVSLSPITAKEIANQI